MELAISPSESNQTILEQIEGQGHSIEYQCRSGFCGACRTKSPKGGIDNIEYLDEPLAFIADGEFLPCCSRAKSTIAIAIDS